MPGTSEDYSELEEYCSYLQERYDELKDYCSKLEGYCSQLKTAIDDHRQHLSTWYDIVAAHPRADEDPARALDLALKAIEHMSKDLRTNLCELHRPTPLKYSESDDE